VFVLSTAFVHALEDSLQAFVMHGHESF
jgi:hypothetical protein